MKKDRREIYGQPLDVFSFRRGVHFCESTRQTLVGESIKFDISRRANDNRDPHSPRVRYAPAFAFIFTRLARENECSSNAALIYREAKALIKIISSLMFREEIAADHLSDAHQRRRFIAFEHRVIYRRYYCDTSETSECLFK